MGTEYYLVDHERLECFYLGKGNWSWVPITPGIDRLRRFIADSVRPGFDPKVDDEYFEEVAKKATEFLENRAVVTLMDDEIFGDDFYTQHSTCKDIPNRKLCVEIGTRYR